MQVVIALDGELKNLDHALQRILPSARASTWEKGIKAVKSLAAQKSVGNFSSQIHEYISSLTAFQISHNTDQIRIIINSVQDQKLALPMANLNIVRKSVWMLEHDDDDDDFVGRRDVLSAIKEQFGRTSRIAITGIGGVGKSRIAIQYCWRNLRHRQQLDAVDSPHVFWVHGGSKAKFEASYTKIARLLDLPGREDRDTDKLELVRDWLNEEEKPPWVMVLDNADDNELWLRPPQRRDVFYLPPEITSSEFDL